MAQASISVLIPAYNAQSTILRALESVASQTLAPMEIIVVDDGSTDDTASLVQEYCRSQKPGFLRLVRLDANHGPSHARNVGWDLASGELLAFLDADDAWHCRKLAVQAEWMTENPRFVLTAHRIAHIRRDEDRPALPDSWGWKAVRPWELKISSCQFWPSSIMLRTGIPYRFERCMWYGEDRLLWMQIALSGHPVARLNLPLGYRYSACYGEAGLSRHLWRIERGELQAFDRLVKRGLLCRGEGISLQAFSLAKYVRRACICGIRARRGTKSCP